MSVVYPALPTGGNGSVQTANPGTTYVLLAASAAAGKKCSQVTFSNQTGTTILVQQDGAGVGFQLATGTYYTFYGIKNTSQFGVKRSDESNSQVTLTYRWEG